MSKIGDAVLAVEEQYEEEFHEAMDRWEFEKLLEKFKEVE